MKRQQMMILRYIFVDFYKKYQKSGGKF